MSEEFDLEYSEDALLNRVLFISGRDKVNLFVEDTKKEYEYEELVEKIFTEDFKLRCIFPTHGKLNMIEAYNLFGNDEEYGKNIFIADGDFDILLGIDMIVADNFIYLEKYNIETYLIDEDAIIKSMRPRLHMEKQQTADKVNFQFWYSTLIPFFQNLFVLHCLVQKEVPSIQNVARNPNSFLLSNGLPNESQYQKYKTEIKEEIEDIEGKLTSLKTEMELAAQGDDLKFICGKYLLASLCLYLNKLTKKKIDSNKLKAELLSRIDANKFTYLKEKIITYLSA